MSNNSSFIAINGDVAKMSTFGFLSQDKLTWANLAVLNQTFAEAFLFDINSGLAYDVRNKLNLKPNLKILITTN